MDVCTNIGGAPKAKLEFKGQAWLALGTRFRGELMCEPLMINCQFCQKLSSNNAPDTFDW